MPIQYSNERTLWEQDGVSIAVADCAQTDHFGEVINHFGKRYLVIQGEYQIATSSLDRAEEIAGEVLDGTRRIGEAA